MKRNILHRRFHGSLLRLFPYQLLKLPAGHGFGKIISLNIITADFPQLFKLLPGLHAFRHHTQIHPTGKTHGKTKDSLAGLLFRFILDKLHIQLQNVNGHLIEHVQGGITAAEIVHLYDKAQFPQPPRHLNDLRRVFRIRAFCYFQMEPGWGKPVFLDCLC